MYQDLSTRHDWPVKNNIVDLPIGLRENSKRISGNSLRPLGAQNKDIGAASQTLRTRELEYVIVSRGDWLGNPENINVENNGAVVYVGSSLTVHNPLFSVHKL